MGGWNRCNIWRNNGWKVKAIKETAADGKASIDPNKIHIKENHILSHQCKTVENQKEREHIKRSQK